MSENIPPGSSGPKAGTQPSPQIIRGLPYYEKLRRDLRDTLQKKRILDKNLSSLEDSLYRLESNYLEETSSAGNIIKGFDNYIKSSGTTSHNHPSTASGTISGSAAGGTSGPATSSRRKPVIVDTDRVFSRSSTSYMRDSDSPSSATTTPGHVQTPSGSFGNVGGGGASAGVGVGGTGVVKGGAGGEKKKKKAAAMAEEEENEGKPNKRARITYGPRE